MNKFGDIFLLIGLIGLIFNFGTLDLEIIFSLLESSPLLLSLSFLIFIGVISKSAQFGLHTWLPDAMEGLGLS